MMKILFIQPTSDKRGHYGLWTSKLCQAMGKLGCDLYLFTNKIYTQRFLQTQPTFEIIECDAGKYAFDRYDLAREKKSLLYWWGYFKTTFVIVKRALKLCKEQQFDAIFLTDVEYLTAALLLKRYKRQLPPVIWHVQAANFTYSTYCGSALKKLYKIFQREIFKSTLTHEVQGFAVLGEFHKLQLRQQLQLSVDFPIEIVPDGAEVYTPDRSQQQARKEIGIESQGTVILFLGMLRKDKGIEYLLEAVAKLPNEAFTLVIAGAPSEWRLEDIQALIPKQIAHKIVLDLQYIPDEKVPFYYNASDVVIFPYSKEYTGGCGPLIKGASAYAKPVLVTDVSDIGRMVRTYENGLIAKPNDASSLAEVIQQYLGLSAEQKQSLQQNAANLAHKHSWETVAAQLLQLLNSVSAYAK